MKKLITAGLIMVTILGTATAVLAEDFGVNRLINDVRRDQNQASRASQRQENRLGEVKKKADRMVDNRIAELNRLTGRINGDGKLTSDEKSALLADIQTAINGLTQLKGKIDADTDLATARADAKLVITNFRVYAILVPKIRLLVTIDNLQALTVKLQGLTPKIADLINNLKNQGKDVSKLQSLLDDANSQLQTINSKLASDKSAVSGVSVSSQNAKDTFVAVRKDLASVRAGFAQFRHDIGQMRVEFKISLKTGNVSPKPTPSSNP